MIHNRERMYVVFRGTSKDIDKLSPSCLYFRGSTLGEEIHRPLCY